MATVRFVVIVILLRGAVVVAGDITPTYAVRCGDVLGPGGQFQLQQDLDCSTLLGITVKDGAILDLNGYIVTCPQSTCVQLTGAVQSSLMVRCEEGSTSAWL